MTNRPTDADRGANKIGQILLIAGAIVLALLIGVLIGRRGQKPEAADVPTASVQISTEEPPARPSTPLEAPVQAPPAAPLTKVTPETQVQEDAAAVGMTTRDEPAETTPAPATAPAAVASEPAPAN